MRVEDDAEPAVTGLPAQATVPTRRLANLRWATDELALRVGFAQLVHQVMWPDERPARRGAAAVEDDHTAILEQQPIRLEQLGGGVGVAPGDWVLGVEALTDERPEFGQLGDVADVEHIAVEEVAGDVQTRERSLALGNSHCDGRRGHRGKPTRRRSLLVIGRRPAESIALGRNRAGWATRPDRPICPGCPSLLVRDPDRVERKVEVMGQLAPVGDELHGVGEP